MWKKSANDSNHKKNDIIGVYVHLVEKAYRNKLVSVNEKEEYYEKIHRN